MNPTHHGKPEVLYKVLVQNESNDILHQVMSPTYSQDVLLPLYYGRSNVRWEISAPGINKEVVQAVHVSPAVPFAAKTSSQTSNTQKTINRASNSVKPF